MPAEPERTSALKKEIVKKVEAHWQSRGKALLLAQLGHDLTKQGYDLKADLLGQKLVPFLEAELKDQIQLLVSPLDPLIRGIIPKSENIDKDDLASLFVSDRQDHNERVTFDKRVWLAFSLPVPENHVRVLQFEPEIHFYDAPFEKRLEKGHLEIPSEIIIPVGSKPNAVRNAEMQQNIRAWLERNGLAMRVALWNPHTVRERGDSLLAALLAALDKKDLDRISLPLDIVAKLLDHNFKRG